MLQAGHTKEELDGSNTAVYVGSFVKGKRGVFGPQLYISTYSCKITNRFVFAIRTGSLNMLLLETELPSWLIEFHISLIFMAQV